MEKYNYYQAVNDDIREHIKENKIKWTAESRDEVEEQLRDDLWTEDSVTGNGSGSYTFNRWSAEENLCHNWGLLEEAMNEFGDTRNPVEEGAEWADVAIRCYLLGGCLSEVMDEMDEEGWAAEEEPDE